MKKLWYVLSVPYISKFANRCWSLTWNTALGKCRCMHLSLAPRATIRRPDKWIDRDLILACALKKFDQLWLHCRCRLIEYPGLGVVITDLRVCLPISQNHS